MGLTSHGNRHAYGHRLKNEYGLDAILVKKALNHTSIDSQLCYTVRSRAEVMTEIERARQRRREQELQEMKAGIQGVREVLRESSGSASEGSSIATGVPQSILQILDSEFQ
jgi:hypothetical protein